MKSSRLFRLGLFCALLAFVSACSTPPTTAAGFKASAQKKFDKGNYEGAVADFSQSIALAATDDIEVYYLRGRARESSGDVDGAIADFSKVIALDPSNAEAYNDRGFARESKGDLEGAAVDLNKAAELKLQQSGR
ncbi:MAG TPA: tetratricopeptide repeat protein [Opitutaceae bacterium]|jgi:Flp pilus assembly protein TadD|nr:tetratricopeptide repeat protein [Opitutaceae bacterium]